ncbi:hypothetical protein LJR219_003119 [Phenylobacterium sp. LjRoot219]|uniref:bestrophin-like domain n=1 Tax=Phenylobacterium sp. LjRoot219 TaxID=3342283 RepID=UPI003ECC5AA5
MRSSWVDVMDAAPALITGLLLFGLMLAAALLGRRLRRGHSLRFGDDGEAKGQEEIILSAVLGLLALLMGFTFSLAVDRFETRRALVVEEANAIGTAYLRAQFLEEPHRTRMSRLLLRYTDNRLALAKAGPERAMELLPVNNALLHDIWTAAKASFPSIRDYDFSSAYVEALNTFIEIGTSRKEARLVRVPPEVFLVLFVYMITTAGVVGYVLKGPRSHMVAVFLLLLMTLSLMLIVDIDRPATGGVREGQGPMEDLRRAMIAWQPATFDPPPAPPGG